MTYKAGCIDVRKGVDAHGFNKLRDGFKIGMVNIPIMRRVWFSVAWIFLKINMK